MIRLAVYRSTQVFIYVRARKAVRLTRVSTLTCVDRGGRRRIHPAHGASLGVVTAHSEVAMTDPERQAVRADAEHQLHRLRRARAWLWDARERDHHVMLELAAIQSELRAAEEALRR
jgi:hypothetical protein